MFSTDIKGHNLQNAENFKWLGNSPSLASVDVQSKSLNIVKFKIIKLIV